MNNMICIGMVLCVMHSSIHSEKIILDSAKQLDGYFIKGGDIESMHVFKMKLKKLIGSVQTDELIMQKEKLQCVKQEIMQLARDFFVNEPHVKPLISKLIQEECKKTDKHESILLKWCEIKHGHEIEAFDFLICTEEDLMRFVEDLISFLENVIYSCPVAEAELREAVKKWNVFKTVLNQVEEQQRVFVDQAEKHLFLQYVKYEKLSHISLLQLVPEYVVSLVNEFYAKQSSQQP